MAYKVYENYVAETGDKTPSLIASTASPYKFADSVALSIGLKEEKSGFDYIKAVEAETGVKVPGCLRDLDKKPVRHGQVIDTDNMPEAVKNSL